jgi:predicted AlkP superfamily pyrophosphatase or phosphodiesterase
VQADAPGDRRDAPRRGGEVVTADRVVVLDVVGLEPGHVSHGTTPAIASLLDGVTAARPQFPALTVPAQSTLATGQSPASHGDVASGVYDRERDAVEFWGRDRAGRRRLWEAAGDAGYTTCALFFQHLVGTTADVAVTPSPIEDENNDMLEMDCWSTPEGFYDDLQAELGHFPLHAYWGPAASAESTRWILAAARRALDRFDPDLLWAYVPHLDYAGLADGPGDEFGAELGVVDGMVGGFLAALRGDGRWEETAVAVASEYGFHAVDRPVFPNRALRAAGLLAVTDDGEGGEEVDLAGSEAFAMVDHQVAHVYADGAAVPAAREALSGLAGVDTVLDGTEHPVAAHPAAGDLILVADRDAWFQYYWWTDRGDAPAYATSVDIHRKPGFDPCELFVGDEGMASLDPSKVGGSHGRVDEETLPALGFGGPAAPPVPGETVDARALAPTLADLLGADVSMPSEASSLVE